MAPETRRAASAHARYHFPAIAIALCLIHKQLRARVTRSGRAHPDRRANASCGSTMQVAWKAPCQPHNRYGENPAAATTRKI